MGAIDDAFGECTCATGSAALGAGPPDGLCEPTSSNEPSNAPTNVSPGTRGSTLVWARAQRAMSHRPREKSPSATIANPSRAPPDTPSDCLSEIAGRRALAIAERDCANEHASVEMSPRRGGRKDDDIDRVYRHMFTDTHLYERTYRHAYIHIHMCGNAQTSE